jgi:NitT/TauT family transport system substrate-binding protein
VTLHLGYFPNLTHASALVGVQQGIFARDLGSAVKLETTTFNAGPVEVQALFSGAIDAAYLGPNAAINAFTQSNGSAIVVVSGATSGGAELVVKPSITTPAQLKGAKLATPQLGNTQDVALRYWLKSQGLTSDTQGGGDVSINPQSNGTAVTAFQSGAIAGGWEPEPYASQMVAAGGHILVDEATLWPHNQFPTTLLAVRKAFLDAHPDVVANLVKGQVDANDFIKSDAAKAQADVNAQLTTLTGKALSASVLQAAWPHLTFTDDPLAADIQTALDHAVAVGLSKSQDLSKLVDLTILNRVLAGAGEPTIA